MLTLSCWVFFFTQRGKKQTTNKHSKHISHLILNLIFKNNSTLFSQMKCLLLSAVYVGRPGDSNKDIIFENI